MKTALIFFSLLLLVSCRKEEIINDPRYQSFIGTWRVENGVQEIEYNFKKNGVIEYTIKQSRGGRFRVNRINQRDYFSYPENHPRRELSFSEIKGNKAYGGFSVYYDSIDMKWYYVVTEHITKDTSGTIYSGYNVAFPFIKIK